MMKVYEIIKKICNDKEVTFTDLAEVEQYKFLGALCTHGCEGIVYNYLKKSGQLSFFGEEFIDTLETLYERNIKEQRSIIRCIESIRTILKGVNVWCAITQDAVLQGVYPKGTRRCKCIDILVEKKGLTEVSNILINNGFTQDDTCGNQNKMYFTKKVGTKYMKIALSCGIKNAKGKELSNLIFTNYEVTDGRSFIELDEVDIFIQLCLDLYKGATTYATVAAGGELLLYKFVDILYYFRSQIKKENVNKLIDRIAQYNVGDAVCYSLYGMEMLLDTGDKAISDILDGIKVKKNNLLKFVYDPETKQKYKYSDFFVFRVLDEKHMKNLILQ